MQMGETDANEAENENADGLSDADEGEHDQAHGGEFKKSVTRNPK